jgi:hypothetical protein
MTTTSRQDAFNAGAPSGTIPYSNVIVRNNRFLGQLVGTYDNGSNNAIHMNGTNGLIEHNYIEGFRNGINGGMDRSTITLADDIPLSVKIRENEIVQTKYGIGCYTDVPL